MILDISIDGKTRVFDYGNKGKYKIELSDRKIGTSSGNVCSICMAGELTDYGGCSTCNNCGAQIRCGL
jgi:hypothetical protein